mmetsp:Transcript_19307/g.21561  ORF Transcript_19307/g.21561 Transcript_19307/m.21561 type:complete len:1019 (+) Transcript_19307:98-3154(+)
MVSYSKHVLIILGLCSSWINTAEGLITSFPSGLSARKAYLSDQVSLAVAASIDLPDENSDQETIRNYLEELSGYIRRDDEENQTFEKQLEQKKRKTRQRMRGGLLDVSLDMASSAQKIGVVLAQVNEGQELIPMENTNNKYLLNLDTLQYRSFPDSVKNVQELIESRVGALYSGVVVLAVDPKGQGYEQGIRPGDTLVASSATMGDNMWPKRTLEGLRSSMSSRKVVSSLVRLQFQGAVAKTDNRYELDIVKPIGMEVEEDDDGYVVVTGFNANAPRLVKQGVMIGDRILSVQSTLGGNFWPVSTVSGVISACTFRLPGQRVSIRFERPLENLIKGAGEYTPTLDTYSTVKTAVSGISKGSKLSPYKEELLLKRCQDVLKRYSKKNKFAGKYDIPGMVADKVTDAIASSSASFDAPTLSLVMNAYNSCNQMDKALHVFEAAVGLKADGSTNEVRAVIKGREIGELTPNTNGLGVFTLSAVLRAWAKKGRTASCKRIMGIMQGRSGMTIEGKKSSSWPTIGTSIIPDITCYNIFLSALAEAGEIEETLRVFDSISTPANKSVEKNLVTYNTVIGALSNAGMSEEALELFDELRKKSIKPDKYTYGCLVKSCSKPQDMQELLYDMKEQGVAPNIITYNTMIKTLCERRLWFEARNLIADMEVTGVKPDSKTYGFLMGGLKKAGKYSSVLTLFESACTDSRTAPLMENVYIYTTAISASAEMNDPDRAFELLKRMVSLGIQPNTKTLTALQKAYLASGKSDSAVDVYRKIKEPDGRAMLAGLEALSLEGEFEEVTSTLRYQWKTRGSALSGKQLMFAFNVLFRETVSQGCFIAARRAFQEFLSMGFIPSKAVFKTIISALRLKPTGRSSRTLTPEIPEKKFHFLLFVMDSLKGRKLSCDAEFYTALLFAGGRAGGLQRRICSLLADSRIDTTEQKRGKSLLSTIDDTISQEEIGWESFYKDYDQYKGIISFTLPPVQVNFGKSQVRTVLLAEQEVTYNGARTRRQKSVDSAKPSVLAQQAS